MVIRAKWQQICFHVVAGVFINVMNLWTVFATEGTSVVELSKNQLFNFLRRSDTLLGHRLNA